MPANANRCPHCWAALSVDVTDFCPFCRRSVAVREKRRRGGGTPEAKAATPPPVTLAPYEANEPSQSYEYNWPAPAPAPRPVPAAAEYSEAPAPAGGGVAVAERDPLEFPGTPLPPGFFDALPEKSRNPRSPRISGKAIGVLGVVVVGAIGGISQAADRSDDLSSPARFLIAGACAEYRDINERMDKDSNDEAAVRDGIAWFQNNVGRFAEAARLDPELTAASDVVAWYASAIEANFAPLAGMTDKDFEAREKPLARVCYNGPGRA